MTFLLVLLTLVILITLDLIKHVRKQAVRKTAPIMHTRFDGAVFERYYHPGHSWVAVGKENEVTIGVDDFVQRVIGGLTNVELPEPGTRVLQGEVYATLHRAEKMLRQVAPVSGVILDVNKRLTVNPELINISPFERGWIAKLQPANFPLECCNLLRGISAERWEEAIRNQLIQWFSTPLHPVLQDGGSIVQNVCDLVDEQEWQRFVQEFFPASVIRRDRNQIKN